MIRNIFIALALCLSTLFAGTARAEEAPTIAAAADLKFALEEVAGLFKKNTGKDVKLAFGSSGNFRRQIAQGAPFQMFLSADEEFILQLAKEGFALDQGTLYAIGRIVIIAPHGSPLIVDGEFKGLKAGLANGTVKRFAIANPEHAPYGKRAEEALKKSGLWGDIQNKLIFGENVAQTAQFATSGSAQGGIIAYSLALAPEVSKLGKYALIPAEWHNPLKQRMALIKGAGETAKAFYAFVQTPPARAIFKKFGFVLPGE